MYILTTMLLSTIFTLILFPYFHFSFVLFFFLIFRSHFFRIFYYRGVKKKKHTLTVDQHLGFFCSVSVSFPMLIIWERCYNNIYQMQQIAFLLYTLFFSPFSFRTHLFSIIPDFEADTFLFSIL